MNVIPKNVMYHVVKKVMQIFSLQLTVSEKSDCHFLIQKYNIVIPVYFCSYQGNIRFTSSFASYDLILSISPSDPNYDPVFREVDIFSQLLDRVMLIKIN